MWGDVYPWWVYLAAFAGTVTVCDIVYRVRAYRRLSRTLRAALQEIGVSVDG